MSDARQEAVNIFYYKTDATRDDAEDFVSYMITACAERLAASVDNIQREQDAQTRAAIARLDKLEMGLSARSMQIDSLDAQQSGQHKELLEIYRRLNKLELHASGMDDTIRSHSRQINALRARTDGIEPGSGKQADTWEDSPIGPDRSPDRLVAIIADLHLQLGDIMGILSRNGVAVRAIASECGNESYLRWERLASKACDNAEAVL